MLTIATREGKSEALLATLVVARGNEQLDIEEKRRGKKRSVALANVHEFRRETTPAKLVGQCFAIRSASGRRREGQISITATVADVSTCRPHGHAAQKAQSDLRTTTTPRHQRSARFGAAMQVSGGAANWQYQASSREMSFRACWLFGVQKV